MLETFLTYLVPEGDGLLDLAASTCVEAKKQGAQYKEVHEDKAKIYTWLAWQDEPGAQLHQAVKEKILIATSKVARPFVEWFRELFEI